MRENIVAAEIKNIVDRTCIINVSQGVIAGILMPIYTVLQIHSFIVCRQHCGQMHVLSYNMVLTAYSLACIVMVIAHTAACIEIQCADGDKTK